MAYPGDDIGIAREFLRIADGVSVETPQLEGEQVIGHYRILRELGRGGQGVVYAAMDTRLQRQVAVKLLLDANGGAKDAVVRFRREAEVTSKLDHPGICAVYETGIHQGHPYIAMRFVEGESLARKITTAREADRGSDSTIHLTPTTEPEPAFTNEGGDHATGPSTEREIHTVLEMIEGVARALHAAHEAGVVHRDIKPGNILIARSGQPVVVDFGLARDLGTNQDTLTKTGELFGTPAYMSPEQLLANRLRIDARTDVYSLGVTLFECLTLRRPFEAPTREGLYQAIMTRPAPDPRGWNSSLSTDIAVVVATALEKDRDRRYQSALALAEDLRRVRMREPILARQIGWAERLLRWGRRNPMAASLLALVFVLLSGGLVGALFLLSRVGAERDQADVHARRAGRNLLAYERLADARVLDDLRREEEESLWPATPDRVPAMEQWLLRARALASRLPEHEDALLEMDHALSPESETDPGRTWRREKLAELVKELRGFVTAAGPETGIRAVEERLEFSRTLDARTVTTRSEEWADCLRRITDNPRYPQGTLISPQLGLVPLGPDPQSGLEEFCETATGQVVVRDSETRRLRITEASAIVLALLPGGSFVMGAQRADPSSDQYDPAARDDEAPLQRIALAPFFLGKHEVSRAQWRRATGRDPSWFAANHAEHVTPLHPVETVSWEECERTLRRLGFSLPTEAQWEYACRAGSSDPWPWGGGAFPSPPEANVADLAFRRFWGPLADGKHETTYDDGIGITGAIDLLAPNRFGLHGMLGNVWEWCADTYSSYRIIGGAGDGLREEPGVEFRVSRGGGYGDRLDRARSACRANNRPSWYGDLQGVRPARRVLN